MRKGVRAGSSALVVHVYPRDELAVHGGPRFGLVVSKQVGNAVARHAVSRKLRALLFDAAGELPHNYDVVVRALPPAAQAMSAELGRELRSALRRATAKL